jgi:transposase InsO family protein
MSTSLFLALKDIDHTKTKAKSPHTNGICERFHRTMLDEFYRVAFRKKLYTSLSKINWCAFPHEPALCYSLAGKA